MSVSLVLRLKRDSQAIQQMRPQRTSKGIQRFPHTMITCTHGFSHTFFWIPSCHHKRSARVGLCRRNQLGFMHSWWRWQRYTFVHSEQHECSTPYSIPSARPLIALLAQPCWLHFQQPRTMAQLGWCQRCKTFCLWHSFHHRWVPVTFRLSP